MSTATYDQDTLMPNSFSFCTVAGNPPVWGCSLCDWKFTVEQCDRLSEVPLLEQGKVAHREHICSPTLAPN